MKKQDTNIESNKEPTSASGCALFCSSPAHDIIFQLGPFASFSRILSSNRPQTIDEYSIIGHLSLSLRRVGHQMIEQGIASLPPFLK